MQTGEDVLSTVDIRSSDDICTVVHAFYDGMERDAMLGAYFSGLDWSEHLPRMVRFWSSIVLQEGGYRGRPFDPHARMPGLTPDHFAHWVSRFQGTVDAHFAGPRAELMKARADQIAGVFQTKLGLWHAAAGDGS